MSRNSSTAGNAPADRTGDRHPFLPCVAGTDDGQPRVCHLEGYVARPPFFREAGDGRDAFLSVTIGAGVPGGQIMAWARHSGPWDSSDSSCFVDAVMRGDLAERFRDVLQTGTRLGVSGTLDWHTFRRRDGTSARVLQIQVDHAAFLGSRTEEGEVTSFFGAAAMDAGDSGGKKQEVPFVELLTGRVDSCSGLRTTAAGVPFLSFVLETSVPDSTIAREVLGAKAGDSSRNCRLEVTAFRRMGESLADVLREGASVCVSGRFEKKNREWNGCRYGIIASACTVMAFPDGTGEDTDGEDEEEDAEDEEDEEEEEDEDPPD